MMQTLHLFSGISGGRGVTESSGHLAVLGQVQGGDLLSLLNLLLVGLDLALELVNQSLHALIVLPVLVLGVGQLLDAPLGLAEVLLSVSKASVLCVQLGLQLPDPGVHLRHRLLASLQSLALGVVDTGLHVLHLHKADKVKKVNKVNKEDKVHKVNKVFVLHLRLQQLALALKTLGAILLGAELVSKPWIGSISTNLDSRN